MPGDDGAAARARVAEIEAALARLRAQCELSMNAFKFDEARALVARIEAAECERALLAETLPPARNPVPPAPYSVARARRRR